MQDLKVVMPLVLLANSDNDLMSLETEAALMAFAFEQYFQANKARDLAEKFDELLTRKRQPTTVRLAQTNRPSIYADPKYPKYTEVQLEWPVAKMWMCEFHQYRSRVVHGPSSERTWGWSPIEHLVMAAFVFPLIVKLRLAKQGHYSMTNDDEADCLSVDFLLSESNWGEETGSSISTKWQNSIHAKRRDLSLRAALENVMKDQESKGITFPEEEET